MFQHSMSQRLLVSSLVAMALPGVAAHAGQAPEAMPRMKQVVNAYVADKTFMGAVLVARDGKPLLDEGYGFADVEWKVANTPQGKFRIGSDTKQFTAAAILLLEERGKLKVEDLVSKYVADAPPAWAKITIYNLLTHTSGIPNFTSFPEYRTTEWKDTTPTELVARFRDKPLEFEPGTKFSYSNSGYVVLGYLLEKVSGETYGEYLQKNVFTPLGMLDTGMDNTALILPMRAQGYAPSARGMEHAGYTSMTIPFSAGALYSTTAWISSHEKEVQALTTAIVNTLAWIHSHSPEEIMAKMPEEVVGKNKDLYLAALKNTIPMYSETGKMDPKGAEAVLAVFSESSPEVAKANIDLSKTWTNKYVDQVKKTTGANTK